MTKSEMRRLQFQRKYTSNEDYENDKAKILDALESFSVYFHPCLLDRVWDLLQQSKWIGLQNAPQKKPYKKPEILKDVDTTTIPN